MTRDMELIRRILFAVEKQFVDVAIYNLQIDGYDNKAVAYHCNLLYQAGLIKDYKDQYADNELYTFGVSSLTWEGHDYLDKIRSETVWNKTKSVISEKGLPFMIETVKEVASVVVSGMVQGAIAGIK